jgi:hypothetical protein
MCVSPVIKKGGIGINGKPLAEPDTLNEDF